MSDDDGHGGVAVVVAGAEIDLATAPDLDAAMAAAAATGPSCVVVDLGGVRFMGAAGLAVLLSWRTAARGRGIDVRLAAADVHLRRLLRLTGLADVLVVHGSVAEAARVDRVPRP